MKDDRPTAQPALSGSKKKLTTMTAAAGKKIQVS
jgi:hypothetical protein